MAIHGGAKNLGRDDIGQIAPGFAADFVGFKTDTIGAPYTLPLSTQLGPRSRLVQYKMHSITCDPACTRRQN